MIHRLCNPICQQAKLGVVASERDRAMRELRVMAEQCQKVVSEFDGLAQHCDTLARESKRVCIYILTGILFVSPTESSYILYQTQLNSLIMYIISVAKFTFLCHLSVYRRQNSLIIHISSYYSLPLSV